MKILALDTSTLRASLAVLRDGGAVFARSTDPEVRHGRGLIPAVRDLLTEAGLRPDDLDAVAVGLGPGSFTGLRIGLTAAKTLAFATARPLIGLDSFDALARNAPDDAPRVWVLADAQRGELFAAEYAREHPGGDPIRRGPTRIVPAASLDARIPAGSYALGPALDRPTLILPDGVHRASPERNHPDGRHLLDLARAAFAAGRREDPYFLEPVYIRRSAAEEKREREQAGNQGA